MSPRCDDLDLFFDGELPTEAASTFRDHLAGCERCQRALRGRMLEVAIVSQDAAPAQRHAGPPPGGAPRTPDAPIPITGRAPRRRAPRWLWPSAAATVAAAATAVWWVKTAPHGAGSVAGSDRAAAVASAEAARPDWLAAERGVDVRFSARALDGHRRRAVVRSAAPIKREQITLQQLAELERTAGPAGVLAAHALKGEYASAADRLSALGTTAAALSDRAALALLESDGPAAAERALSFAAEARRLDAAFAPARWNEAVALERLQLPLAAAEAFDAVAARQEAGWSAEAAARAAELRAGAAANRERELAIEHAADAMTRGGPVLSADHARLAPGIARAALHVAVAATADPARLAELARLADGLGAGAELARIRASDLARRAPIAAALAALLPPAAPAADGALPKPPPAAALRALRTRAHAAGLADIARACTLVIPEALYDQIDRAEVPSLEAAGAWWRLGAVTREVSFLTYNKARYLDADAAARPGLAACAADADPYWCPQLLRHVATSSALIGRVDRGFELGTRARALAQRAGDRKEQTRALSVLGQLGQIRSGVDPITMTSAYLHESALRSPTLCASRLYHLDFTAHTAADHHRHDEAARLLDAADRIDEQPGCEEGVRYNAEELRLQLIERAPAGRRERIDQLERRVERVRRRYGTELSKDSALFGSYLIARARLADRPDDARAAELQGVADQARALGDEGYAPEIVRGATSALVEHAARQGRPGDALAGIARLLGLAGAPDGCTVGINHDQRVTVAVRGANQQVTAEVRTVREGDRVIAPDQLLSHPQRARLAGCESIEVLATGPYFGVAGMLAPDQRWWYRSSAKAPTGPVRVGRQVVVTDVESPPELGLPPLRRMQLAEPVRVVARGAATPDNVLAAIADAELVVINAHGVTDANEPSAASLVLSPDAKGAYGLTAERVKQAKLTGAPVVILAACHAGRVQVALERWSLASSFLAAGARAVIAPTTEIGDDQANEVFESIVQRMRQGQRPEQAVAEERKARGDRVPWLASVVVFQ